MVWPTIAGEIIDARDQVFTTFFSLREFIRSIFFLSDSWMNGPFFTERLTYLLFLFFGRSVTKRSVRGFLRVLRPMAGLPHGVCAWPPTGDLASPPPCGWSRGDITTPRTAGRQPMRLLWPALPTFWFSCSTLPSWPMVARQRTCT